MERIQKIMYIYIQLNHFFVQWKLTHILNQLNFNKVFLKNNRLIIIQ